MRRTHKQRVLELLSDGRWHAHGEGYRLGVMLHSRVADLRKDGYTIECKRGPEGYLYKLHGSLESAEAQPATPVSAVSSEPWRSNPVSAETAAADVLRDGGQLALSISGATNHA